MLEVDHGKAFKDAPAIRHVVPEQEPPASPPQPVPPAPVAATQTSLIWNRHVRVSALIVGDAVAFTVAAGVAGLGLRAGLPALVLAVLILSGARLYRPRLSLSALDDAPVIVAAALGSSALVSFGLALTGSVTRELALAAPLFALLAVLVRSGMYTGLRWARRTGRASHRALVVGGGLVATEVSNALINHPEYGVRPVGFLDDSPFVLEANWPIPRVGGYADLAEAIQAHDARNVIVAFGSSRESVMVDVLRTCDRLDVEFFFVPRLYELSSVHRGMDVIWGIPLVRLRRAPFRSPTWQLKRLFDIVVAGLALILLAPVLLVFALLVWFEVRSPILFRQERLGLDGRPFTIYKFCSLRPGDGTETAWNVANDERLGPIGRFLRKTSIDELPQLWNVLRGDMTLVGPRPERAVFAAKFAEAFPRYEARHRVPVGMTGWAQVHGLRGDTSIVDRARFDNNYIENWSLWEDLKIMLRTVGQVVRVRGR